jgi:hypothetical protein
MFSEAVEEGISADVSLEEGAQRVQPAELNGLSSAKKDGYRYENSLEIDLRSSGTFFGPGAVRVALPSSPGRQHLTSVHPASCVRHTLPIRTSLAAGAPMDLEPQALQNDSARGATCRDHPGYPPVM